MPSRPRPAGKPAFPSLPSRRRSAACLGAESSIGGQAGGRMSRQKGKFLPVTIRFADGSSMIVSSICDAAKALDRKWHSKDCHLFLEAERLIAAARDGSCKPEVALQ
ncbi:MAG: DUF982 domain-containing protein, partial [Mesorhizobium sp.]